MPPIDEIQAGLTGAWQLMFGKVDGLRLLDLSADGFWNSFFAMLVALPPLFVIWSSFAIDAVPDVGAFGARLSLMLRLALTDLAAWVLPLVMLAGVAQRVGIRDRFVHYVVSTNWASGIIAWMLLPPAILRRLIPADAAVAALLSVLIFLASLVLMWRLTNAVLGKGASVATAVFAGMIAASLLVVYGFELLLGIPSLTPAG